MGAWGTGNFDNDQALDVLPEMCGSAGHEAAFEYLRAVDETDEDDSPSASDCCRALAAAELVALRREPGVGPTSYRDMPAGEPSWDHRPTEKEVELAIRVVHRIATDSELSDLWQESDEDFEAWADVLDELLRRLGDEGL